MIAGSTSTHCCSASIPPNPESADSPPRRRRRSSPSTCSHSTTIRCSTVHWPNATNCSSEQLAKVDAPIYLCPHTTDAAVAQRWFIEFEGAGLDGVVAKRLSDPYTPDKRTLIKVKHQRTADCVIAGYRVHKDGNGVGSLLLGLYDDSGDLHHVGVVASFTVKRRAELLAELEPLTHNALENHPWRDWAEWSTKAEESGTRMPGAGSRWNAGKDLSWVPLRIERVAEVTFGQLQEGRFRHGSQFVRWRPDREPESCRYDQLEVASPVAFASVVERGSTATS